MTDPPTTASETSSDAVPSPVLASADVVTPEVESLRAMFPAMDVSDLTAVLTSHNGSLEEAADTLLAMNDPTYRQADLERLQVDAELARQLEAQEERLLHRRAARQSAANPEVSSPAALPYTPYVPRHGARQPLDQGQHAEADNNADDIDQLTEQMYVFSQEADPSSPPPRLLETSSSKLAEQGRKTFDTFLGKAKGFAGVLNERIKASASPSLATEDVSPPPPPKEPILTPATSTGTPRTSRPTDDKHQQTVTVPERLPRPNSGPEEPFDENHSPSSTPTGSGERLATHAAVSPDPLKPDLSQIEHLLLPRKSVKLEQAHQKEDDDDDELEYVKSPFDDD
ncbi:BZ3500_MvSof-1268-A1-R1_Chr4-2g07219 [Microbotryum saponariae]|uniref:BZ3500_MvSof-1268-A1-R1_Chr4-2g07219 protein n=1 Tax=Microbotryum saponariae TaxID=289078 RepID=A0A2X0LIJ2_9BASI|nr:BZ3500_MvSof-1268-A1-R1_Chr4-2g07219 [Microbotryum saponariae]SDA06884.1 BZ3501_MvSof-1269-A2-R1_Chr4-2g06930 [Microbotryum saponariae]